MAFPTIQGTNNSEVGSPGSTTHTMSLPSSIASGELLIAVINWDENPTIDTTPSGWTQFVNVNFGSTTKLQAYRRVADGSEGSTISMTTVSAQESGHWTCRISGQHASTVPAQATDNSQSATTAPDPPSLNPADWDVEDTLWITGYGASGNDSDADAYPTGFSYLTFTRKYADGSSGEGGIAIAAKQDAVASINPSAFSLVTGNNRAPVTFTIAIRPAEGRGLDIVSYFA